jgi:hypothetical protein
VQLRDEEKLIAQAHGARVAEVALAIKSHRAAHARKAP